MEKYSLFRRHYCRTDLVWNIVYYFCHCFVHQETLCITTANCYGSCIFQYKSGRSVSPFGWVYTFLHFTPEIVHIQKKSTSFSSKEGMKTKFSKITKANLINPPWRLVCRLILSAAEILSKKWTLGGEAMSGGQMWNFGNIFSATDIISRHISKPDGDLSFYNPYINSCIVHWAAIEISLMSPSLFVFLPCWEIKMKKLSSCTGFFPLAFWW